MASAWADALEEAADALLAEAWRRATEGVEEPIMHQGQVVTTVRKYSDLLLIFLLKSARLRVPVDDGWTQNSLHIAAILGTKN